MATAAATATAPPAAQPRVAAMRHGLVFVLVARAVRVWETTPGRLRAGRGLVVFILLLTGTVGALGARVRVDAAREIQARVEPVSADAIEVYRSLADADSTVAAEFLPGVPARPGDRARYDDDVTRAATSLISAGTRAGERGLAAAGVSDIAALLPVYTDLVGHARANNRPGSTGAAEVQRASELMQSTMLRRAEALERYQSDRLDDQYARATALPGLVLLSGFVSLVALALIQFWLFRKTRRVLNPGLLASTAALTVMALWWAGALSVSQRHLDSSRRHSALVSDALAPAQIAARQARTSEILGLVAAPVHAATHEQAFTDRAQRLLRANGAGGALGAARRLASGSASAADVEAAVAQTRVWLGAHEQVRMLNGSGRQGEAIALATGSNGNGAAKAFADLDSTLARAVADQRAAFRRAIADARAPLGGLVVGTCLLAVVTGAAAAWGIAKRLKEYR